MSPSIAFAWPRHQRQSGLTIIESLVVLAIFAIIVFGVIRFLGARKDAVAQNEMKVYANAAERVRNTLNNQPNFANATTANAVNLGWFPRAMINGANIVNDWGGNITLAGANCIGANDCFTITSPSVPEDICKILLPLLDAQVRRLDATPAAGAAAAVKPLDGVMNFANVGAGCGTTTATIVATFGRT